MGELALPPPEFRSGEEMIGAYRDMVGSGDHVVVTSVGLHVWSPDGWRMIPYRNIGEVVVPHSEDSDLVETLYLRMRDGSKHGIPIRGGTGRFRDAWEFLRFLQRVVRDLEA